MKINTKKFTGKSLKNLIIENQTVKEDCKLWFLIILYCIIFCTFGRSGSELPKKTIECPIKDKIPRFVSPAVFEHYYKDPLKGFPPFAA